MTAGGSRGKPVVASADNSPRVWSVCQQVFSGGPVESSLYLFVIARPLMQPLFSGTTKSSALQVGLKGRPRCILVVCRLAFCFIGLVLGSHQPLAARGLGWVGQDGTLLTGGTLHWTPTWGGEVASVQFATMADSREIGSFADGAYELVPTPPDEVQLLPPTGTGGPVVLDMPYEPMPTSCDFYPSASSGFPDCFDDLWAPRPWFWQLMPNNLIYTSYLAGPKEPRFATVWYNDTEPSVINPNEQNGWLWDSTLGGRVSLVRYGSDPVLHPQGFEVQLEGAAFVRLDPEDDRDLRSADYRFGIPVVYGVGRWQTKLAYYHNSAHLGDEFQIKYPWYERINYVRDVIVWGNSYYLYDWLRLYGEVGYSFFNSGGSEPWEFQYGTELIQARPTGIRGAPFLAVNGISRQELDWGGNVCVQVGWAWRGRRSERLFRLGFEYLYGADPQFEFLRRNQNPFVASDGQTNQNRAGIGMWYDY